MAENIKKNEWVLVVLGLIVGATIVAFVAVGIFTASKSDTGGGRITLDTNKNEHVVVKEVDLNDDAGVLEETDSETTSDGGAIAVGDPSDAPVVVEDPKVITLPQKVYGEWYLVRYNNEHFDIDDEDDDVTKIEFDHVCGGKNRGWTTYCDNAEKLRKTTAEKMGEKECSSSQCRVGESCFLWNAVQEDDGDVEMKTATYTCA